MSQNILKTLPINYFCLMVVMLVSLSIHAFGRDVEQLPKIHPSYITDFTNQNNLYANNCFENVVQDTEGRLWLSSCGNHTVINSLGLTWFDGYKFSPFQPHNSIQRDKKWDIAGINSRGELYGAIGNTNMIFTIDPDAMELQVWPMSELPSNGISIKSIVELSPDQYYILIYDLNKNSLILSSWDKNHFSQLNKGNYPRGLKGINWDTPLLVDENDIWFMGTTFPLVRFDMTTNDVRTFNEDDLNQELLADFDMKNLQTKPELIRSRTGIIYFYVPDYYGNLFFSYDKTKDRFLSIANQYPEDWKPDGLFQDNSGNICFLFRHRSGKYKAIIEDTLGVRYDYTPVLTDRHGIHQILSKNYFNDVFVASSEGLSHIEINTLEGIQTVMKGDWISSMTNLNDTTLLVNGIGMAWKKINTRSLKVQLFDAPDCGTWPPAFDKGMKQQIRTDSLGNKWFLSNQYLVKYNPIQDTCSSFPLSKSFGLFAFLNDHIVVLGAGRKLQMYDTRKKTFITFPQGMIKELPGRLRDLYIDQEGILWIPTNDGLMTMDHNFIFNTLKGGDDVRFTSIYEMLSGYFWLGTYFHGVWIYDPVSGEIKKIQNKDGLSNNAVMSIIADDDGFVWVGTEFGISLLSPDGDVLGELHAQDGLSFEIFERFDAYKDAHGKLYFGSRNGTNVIDPQVVRKSLTSKKGLNIYLTEITWHNKGKDISRQNNLKELKQISLPAQRKHLNLKFALSSYLDPSQNQYYYKIQGIDDQWISLGNQHELNLNHLPAGEFTLLIRGEDLKHNASTVPLSLSIYAAEYFYKEWWFQLVLISILALAALLWVRNLRRQRQILELEVARRTNQIQTDKETIEHQAQKLRKLDDLKTRFFNNISHELRTPLTLIKVPVEKALNDPPDTRRNMRSLLWSVHQNSKRLLSLINGYLELSKLDIGVSKAANSTFELKQFVRNVISAFVPAATSKQIEITVDFSFVEDVLIETDQEKLETILSNILVNAVKFTHEKGRITLHVNIIREMTPGRAITDGSAKRPVLKIKITDDGPGITADVLPHIFDRYFQGGDQLHKGSGIGLAISKELSELLGGSLTAESEPGQGTIFHLQLPVLTQESMTVSAQPLIKVHQELLVRSTTAKGNGQYTILLVEDDRELQQLLRSLLTNKYKLIVANHGKEAWELMTGSKSSLPPVDALICDLMMPVMDGMTLLKHMKDNQQWKNCPILVLSARAGEESKLQTLRMGVDDYLNKPFSSEELVIRLENMIANDQRRQSIRNSFKGMMFDDVKNEEEVWLSMIRQIIQKTLKQNIHCTVTYMADQVNLSERQLNRRLKGLTGLSTNLYIREVKLQNARHMLENKSMGTVAEVAYASGFNSPGYFSKLYFDRFGRKPGEYFN